MTRSLNLHVAIYIASLSIKQQQKGQFKSRLDHLYNMNMANVSLVAFLLYNSHLGIIKSPDCKATDLFPFGAVHPTIGVHWLKNLIDLLCWADGKLVATKITSDHLHT